jgi:hypothetical protein
MSSLVTQRKSPTLFARVTWAGAASRRPYEERALLFGGEVLGGTSGTQARRGTIHSATSKFGTQQSHATMM